MKRSDRKIKDPQEILELLERCEVIRLGISAPDYPYVLPMNFGMESEGATLVLWFHCAKEGKKLDLIRQNHRIGFQADHSLQLIKGDKPCSFGMRYESVMGYGDVHILTKEEEKRRGLRAIMRHYAKEEVFDFSEAALSTVCVLRLDVIAITGKRMIP